MWLTNDLRTAMLDCYARRLSGYPKVGTLLEEALELIMFGDLRGWKPRGRKAT